MLIIRSKLFATGVLLLCAFMLVPAHAAVITGPTLTQNEFGHNGHGIVFEAIQSVSLVGFQFSNQGQADIIQLYDTTAALMVGTFNVPAGNPILDVTVDWDLTAGHSYNLIGTTMSNGKWTDYSGFPIANTDIRITGGYFTGFASTYWGDFKNITTGEGTPGEVPEPAALALVAGGLAFLVLRRPRR